MASKLQQRDSRLTLPEFLGKSGVNGRISGARFAPICGFAFAGDERCHGSLVTFALDSIVLYLG